MVSSERTVPHTVVKRLTRYLAHVQMLSAAGVQWVSSRDLADTLGLTPSTVRQDLSHVDFSGISKRGYETCGLRDVLMRLLGADKEWRMVVVGAGNLGKALALHEDFGRRGFRICGVFDSDPRKVGRRVGSLTTQPMRELGATVVQKKVDIGVIAVPAAAAQGVSDILIAAGVHGLLNMTLTHIVAPDRVAVIDSRIVASLLELSHAIRFG